MLDRFGNTIAAGDEVVLVGTMRAELGALAVLVLGGVHPLRVTGADTILASALGTVAAHASTHMPGGSDVLQVGDGKVLGRLWGTGAGDVEELPSTELGQDLLNSPSSTWARMLLGLGTAAVVNTGTGAGDVPTTSQADARYDASGAAAGAYASASADLAAHDADAGAHSGTFDAAGTASAGDAAHVAAADPHTQYARKAQNLADLTSASTARSNLGLGTAATVNTGTASGNVPLMSQHVDYVDIPNAGLPMKFTSGGDVPAHAHATLQPLDATLTALAGLDTTAGLVEQTGTDAFAKRALGVGASTSVPTRADADARYAAASHTHAASDITSGTIAVARLPSATTSAQGIVELATDGENAANVVVQGNDTRVNKSTRTLAQTLDSAEVASSTAENTLCDLTVAANTLGTTGAVELVIQGYIRNSSGGTVNYTPRVYWGGTAYWGDVFGVATGTPHRPFEIRVRVQNLSAANKQSVRGVAFVGSASAGSTNGLGNFGAAEPNNPFSHDSSTTYPNKDTTSNQNVKVTMQMGTSNANAAFKLDLAVLTLIPGA